MIVLDPFDACVRRLVAQRLARIRAVGLAARVPHYVVRPRRTESSAEKAQRARAEMAELRKRIGRQVPP